MRVVRLILPALVGLLVGVALGQGRLLVVTPAAPPSATKVIQWSVSNCQWAIGTMVWDAELDNQTSDQSPDQTAATYYRMWAGRWSLVIQAIATHCGTVPRLATTPSDTTAVSWLADGQQSHEAAPQTFWNKEWATYYTDLIALFKTDVCTPGPNRCRYVGP